MRMAEFRSDPSLVSQWKEMYDKHALLRLVLDVMDQEHPARMRVPSNKNEDISATMACIELGDTRGYSKYAIGLKLMTMPKLKESPLPETTYEQDEPEITSPKPKPRGRPRKE